MFTLICPTRFKSLWCGAILALFVNGCATDVPSQPQTGTAPARALVAPAAPSVLIRGKGAAAILTRIVKYRTQKGMKIVERDSQRVVFSMPVPKSMPPAEVRMVFSLAPAADGLQLSGQVFQIVREKGKKPVTRDVTAGLTDKLEAELAMYAKP